MARFLSSSLSDFHLDVFQSKWELAPAVSHSGYAGILVGGKNRFVTGSFFEKG